MVTTVKLQPPFEYSWWVLWGTFILMAIALTILVLTIKKAMEIRKKNSAMSPAARKVVMTPEILRAMKKQYVDRVQRITVSYENGAITKRDGYQELSAVIRGFVHEVTGINVENLTRAEVRALGIRKLDLLMDEYYVPEFAEEEKALEKDLLLSCRTAMGVIRSWS